MLANAFIIDDEQSLEGVVSVGSTVTLQFENEDEHETYMIVGAAEANPNENRISNESPIGHSLIGKHVGDKVKVETPGGAFYVEIIASK